MSSHTSPSPSSPSYFSDEERITRTMGDVIKNYKTEELIDYLRRQEELDLKESHFKIFRQQEISGFDFLETTEEKFRSYGLKGGPATRLAKFIEGLGQKLQLFFI
ncbi:hypothetical protein Glove_302g53 [Diversispora epigaea]|uniref:Uncharacterized protein n=1 Tax=Diversispora epigaea TaxID=1348612 RepID=A0A397I2Y0_9GLOM|nr:hypothetical protein Glove_302g53 [Diversispora epigaea]